MMIQRDDRTSVARMWGARLLAGLTMTVLASGCITSEVINVTELSLSGPIPQAPVRVTVDSIPARIIFSPRVSRFPAAEVHGTTGTRSYYAPSTANDLVWEVTRMEYAFDAEVSLTGNFALSGGVSVGQGDNDTYVNARVGLGLFGTGDGVGARLDGGLIFSSLDYSARTTVTTTVDYWLGGRDTYTTYFADRGSTSRPGVYLQLTLNSAIRHSPVNVFVSGGVTWRNLAGFSPTQFDSTVAGNDFVAAGGTASEPAVFFNVTPGLAVDLWGSSRFLMGARMLLTDIASQSPSPVWMPFIQLDLAL